jgi:hypothetical protein
MYPRYSARPHPGKNNYFDAADMRTVYPRFDDFVSMQRAIDPTGKFANAYIHCLLDGVDCASSHRRQ